MTSENIHFCFEDFYNEDDIFHIFRECASRENKLWAKYRYRSKIRSDQKRLFIAVGLSPLSFFANTPFKRTVVNKGIAIFVLSIIWNAAFIPFNPSLPPI